MENKEKAVRNVTISTKVSASEKIALQQIANDHNITRSELIYDILHNYKHCYNYIGRPSPKEEKLAKELKNEKKENRKLALAIENAEHRIEIEQNLNKKAQQELFDLNENLMESNKELKTKNTEIQELLISKRKSDELLKNGDDKGLYYYSLGSAILTGISLLFLPVLYRK